jgi:hypothetical protein
MLKQLATLAFVAWIPASGASAQVAEKPLSIVLGAFVDGSGWRKVYDILTKDGYETIVVQNRTHRRLQSLIAQEFLGQRRQRSPAHRALWTG